MDELALFVTAGDPADKHAQESVAAVASVHKSQHYTTFRNAECPVNGAALTGFGPGERLFVASPNKALVTAYAWGKESADQRFAVPEQLTCMALARQPRGPADGSGDAKPHYRVPWLLAGGSKSGKVYVWELASGELVCVKDGHYQEISSMAFSACGTFLVTGGLDTRVNVWKTLDLVSPTLASSCKAYASFTDHALAVTQVQFVGAGLSTDFRVVSASRDSTLRIYDVLSRALLTTLVFSAAVECFARDPSGRAYYAGLGDGSIRQVDMYVVNPYTHVLEPLGGGGKIVTVAADPTMAATFVHHQNDSACTPTCLQVTMDGMCVVSGDSQGRTFVADVVTKQVVKSYTPRRSAIAYLQLGLASSDQLASEASFEKKHRLLPPLKRVLASTNLAERSVTMQIPESTLASGTFDDWLQRKAQEELQFKTPSDDQSSGESRRVLQEKLDRVSAAYSSLKELYDELLREHQAKEEKGSETHGHQC